MGTDPEPERTPLSLTLRRIGESSFARRALRRRATLAMLAVEGCGWVRPVWLPFGSGRCFVVDRHRGHRAEEDVEDGHLLHVDVGKRSKCFRFTCGSCAPSPFGT